VTKWENIEGKLEQASSVEDQGMRKMIGALAMLVIGQPASAVLPPPAHPGQAQEAENALAPLQWMLGSWKGDDEVLFPNARQAFPIYVYAATVKGDPSALYIYIYFKGGGGRIDIVSALTVAYSAPEHKIVAFRSRGGSAGATAITIGPDQSISWSEPSDEIHYPSVFKLAPAAAGLDFSNTVTGRDAPFNSGHGVLSEDHDPKALSPF
jgi:hypothetical protein